MSKGTLQYMISSHIVHNKTGEKLPKYDNKQKESYQMSTPITLDHITRQLDNTLLHEEYKDGYIKRLSISFGSTPTDGIGGVYEVRQHDEHGILITHKYYTTTKEALDTYNAL